MSKDYLLLHFAVGQVLSISGYDLENGTWQWKARFWFSVLVYIVDWKTIYFAARLVVGASCFNYIDPRRWFELVLYGFRSFWIVLDHFSLFLTLVSTMIRPLICGNNLNWLLNVHLIYETQWTGVGSGLLVLMLEKLNWFCLISLITLVLLMWKWMDLFLRKNYLLRSSGGLSLLNWIMALTLLQLLKLMQRKLEPLFVLWSFFA